MHFYKKLNQTHPNSHLTTLTLSLPFTLSFPLSFLSYPNLILLSPTDWRHLSASPPTDRRTHQRHYPPTDSTLSSLLSSLSRNPSKSECWVGAWVFGGCSDLAGGCFNLATTRFARLLDFQIRFFVRGFSFQVFDLVLWVFLPFWYKFLGCWWLIFEWLVVILFGSWWQVFESLVVVLKAVFWMVGDDLVVGGNSGGSCVFG